MSDEIVLEPIISEDPFSGQKTVTIGVTACPAINALIHRRFCAPGPEADDEYKLMIIPFASLSKDGESSGGLLFTTRMLRGEVALIQILFDDNSIIEKETTHISDNDYLWTLTDEDCESFLFKKIKIIRTHCGDSFYDYNLEVPPELEILYKGLPELFQKVLERFLMVAAKEIKWAPITLRNKEEKGAEKDSTFEECADFCYVYLMNDTANGYYKIGMSNNPEYRETTLQSEKPTIVKVCQKKFPSRRIAQAIESALHRVYESKRIRGEWFSLKGKDIWEIKQTLS